MKAQTIALLVLLGCSRSAPEARVVTFGSEHDVAAWFNDQCGRGELRRASVNDVSRGQAYFSEFLQCAHILAIDDATVELRGDGHEVCGVRIGPSKLGRRMDASFVLPWFHDQTLAERVATALATEQASIVDGLFVGMVQDMSVTNKFMLVIDGCGHYPADSVGGPISMY